MTTTLESTKRISTEIITTGTEILLGEIVDTNAAWIAKELREAGINLYYKSTIGDNQERIRSVLELGMGRSDVLLVTGGLGPTVDDVTRDAIAGATDRPLQLHEDALATLKARFERFGSKMTENNTRQVMLPTGAILIENPIGTAPGFIVETEEGTIIAMPGVPREMKQMMTDSILPYLRKRNGDTGIIRRRVLRTVNIGESTLDSRIDDLMQMDNPTIGLAAHTAQVDVRITASAESAETAEAMIDEMEATLRARIGPHVYSNKAGETIEAVVAALCQQQKATITLTESNTDGLLAQRLSRALPGFNPLIHSSILNDAALATLLDAEPFKELALAVATQSRKEYGTTYGLSLIGSSGADQGIYGSERGETWIALVGPNAETLEQLPFGGQDEYTQVQLCNGALGMLWRMLEQQY